MRDGAVRQFLYEFFGKAKLGEHATKFDLLKVANVNKIKMLQSQGVKEIWLRATLYQATVQYERRKSQTSGILGTIAKQIRTIAKAESEDFDDSIRVEVTITTDERVRKHLTVGEKRIETLGVDVVRNQEDYDDYIILTKAGQKVGANEIYIKDVMQIDSLGKSVKRNQAWDALASFYKELEKLGALEQ
jgi:hypothetical protein